MTEKRLIVRDGDYAWIDTTTNYVVEVEDAFDLINQLHEENEQLKSYTGEMEDYLARLEEENEQLKKQIDNMAFILRQNGLGLMEDDG